MSRRNLHSRKTYIALTISLLSITLLAQNKYIKLISEGHLSEANAIINQTLNKKNTDPCALYYKAQILADPESPIYNIDSAYVMMTKAKKMFNLEKNKDKFQKINISFSAFRKMNDTICHRALKDAQRKDTEEAYKHFLKFYKTAQAKYVKVARSGLASEAYMTAKKTNRIEAYKDVIKRFKKSQYADSARMRIYELEFRKVKLTHNIEDALSFIRKYPQAPQTEKLQEMVDSIEYAQVENNAKGDWTKFRDFLNSHPENKYYERAEDSIFNIYQKTTNTDDRIDIMEYGATYFSGRHRIEMLSKYHDYYTSDGDAVTVKQFYDNFDDEIFNGIRHDEIEMAKTAEKLNLDKRFDPGKTREYCAFIRKNKNKDIAFVALQRLISIDLERNDYRQAIHTLINFQKDFPANSNNYKWTTDLINLLKTPKDRNVKEHFISDQINSHAEEYSPVVNIYDDEIFFCGKYRGDNLGGATANNEDIYFAHRDKKGKWGKPTLLTSLSSAMQNEAPLSISPDGCRIIIFRDGLICEAHRTKSGWSDFKEIDYLVNQNDWQSDACLTSDGRAILFAAEKEDNYNTTLDHSYHGEFMHASDIYVVYLNEDDSLVGPVNLGPVINTRYSDRSPFLHADMNTLYFSSNGHGGMGHRDIFVSHRLSDTCWTQWSEPVNIGTNINSERDDIEFKVALFGDKAYYHKNYKGNRNYNIYWTEMPHSVRPNPIAIIRGQVTTPSGEPIEVCISWTDIEGKHKIGNAVNNPDNGNYVIILPLGKNYKYTFTAEGYKSVTETIDLTKQTELKRIDGKNIIMSWN